MAQSWFYLTLFRGSPPELTEHYTVEISTTDGLETVIVQKDSAAAVIHTTEHHDAVIKNKDCFTTVVTQKDEVTIHVYEH